MQRGFLKLVIIIFITFAAQSASAQYGYVKFLQGDSVVAGYLRYYVSAKDGHPGFEIWKTKTDKHPQRVEKSLLQEYALKKDTFRIIRDFRPFADKDLYFSYAEAKVISRGKVNLYGIMNYNKPPHIAYSQTGTAAAGVSVGVSLAILALSMKDLYILEDRQTGFKKAIPGTNEKRVTVLAEFLPEKYVMLYAEKNGKISNGDVPEVVRLYNSR